MITRESIAAMERALSRRMKANTDFPPAEAPDGTERLALLQDGGNVVTDPGALYGRLSSFIEREKVPCALTVETGPGDADVLIDGIPSRSFSGFYGDVVAIAVSREGFAPQEVPWTLRGDETVRITLLTVPETEEEYLDADRTALYCRPGGGVRRTGVSTNSTFAAAVI